jgi:rare lipoprotein A (peptidoglycan hydrolase)
MDIYKKNVRTISFKITKIFLTFIFFLILLQPNIFSQANEINGICKLYDNKYIGKYFQSGYYYNPEDLVCSSRYYELYSLLIVENINNGKKTLVLVIDNSLPKEDEKDILLYLSKRAFVELSEIYSNILPAKVTLVKKLNKNEFENSLKNLNKSSQTEIQQKKEDSSNIDKTSKIYYIQVGVFSKEENYKNVQNHLISLGFNVIIKETTINNNKAYKVIIGPFDYDKISEILKIIQNLGYKDAFIIKSL